MQEAEADGRFGIGWNAATLMLQGQIDEALETLEAAAAVHPDDWSRCVLAGCAELREAHGELRQALRLMREGRIDLAAARWQAAAIAAESASHAVERLGGGRRYQKLPDPWPHLVELFRDHLEEAQRDLNNPAA
jgi:tetratricopeptide (TPR) repeat protein